MIESLFYIILDQSWKVAAVVLVILAIRRIFGKRLSPAVRHALWLFVALAALTPGSLLPRPTIWLPAEERGEIVGDAMVGDRPPGGHAMVGSRPPGDYVSIADKIFPSMEGWHFAQQNDGVVFSAATAPDQGRDHPALSGTPPKEGNDVWNIPWFTLLVHLWFFGFAILLTLALVQLVLFRRKLSCAMPVTDGEILAVMKTCQTRLGIVRTVPLAESQRIAAPILLGLLRPRVIVPSAFVRSCTPEQFEHFLLHELAHLKRHDIFYGWMMALLCLVHWFNPLLWIAIRKMNDDAEEATDQLALSQLSQPQHARYGKTLVSIAEKINLPTLRTTLPTQTLGIIGIIESPSQLTRRIEMITQTNHWKHRWVLLAICLCLVVSAATLTQFRHVEAQVASETADGRPQTAAELALDEKMRAIAIDIDLLLARASVQNGVQTGQGVNIHGTVLLPDGSPSAWSNVEIASTGIIRLKNDECQVIGSDGSTIAREGTFNNDSVFPGMNVAVVATGTYDTDSRHTHRRLVSRPIVFVANDDMEPLKITMEEGIPVRGKITYENGSLAVARRMMFFQHIEPIVGADIPEMKEKFRIVRRTEITNSDGEYEIFLTPGTYTVFGIPSPYTSLDGFQGKTQTFTIAEGDTEKRLDWTMPTPVLFEAVLENGTQLNYVSYWFTNETRNDRWQYMSNSPFFLESEKYDGTLYLIDNRSKNGIAITITPDMVGTTQRFTLKPMSAMLARFVDADGQPMVGKHVELLLRNTHGDQPKTWVHGHSAESLAYVETDLDGRAVLHFPSGKISVVIRWHSDFEVPQPDGSVAVLREVEKEFDLVPYETYNFGTLKLVPNEPGTERSVVSEQNVETPQLGLFQMEENGKTIWAIRGRILYPDGTPARNLNVSFHYGIGNYPRTSTDDDGYFTEKRGVREPGDSQDDVLLVAGVSPKIVSETEPWQWTLPPTLLKDTSKQSPDKFVFRLQKGCPLTVDVRFAGESPRPRFVTLECPVKDEDNLPQGYKLSLSKDNAEYYCCALAPGEYNVFWADVRWETTLLSITEDDVVKGIPKKLTLDVPVPSMIDLGEENDAYRSIATIQETRLGHMDESGNYRGMIFTYTSTSERNAEGKFLVWLSPGFNVMYVADSEKGGMLCIVEPESAGKVYSLEVKPLATGKIQLLDKETREPLAGVQLEYGASFDYHGKRQGLGISKETATDAEGVAEFKGMIPDVEYHITNPRRFENAVKQFFVATKPGEVNDFGEIRVESITGSQSVKNDLRDWFDYTKTHTGTMTDLEKQFDTKRADKFESWKRAADAGIPEGQILIGLCHVYGAGVPKDDAVATQWIRKAAEQGNAIGQGMLGSRYSVGTGVARDAEEGVKWVLKSAEQGFAESQWMLSIFYGNGWGVPEDEAKSVEWLIKAAEQGHVEAQFDLGRHYAKKISASSNFVSRTWNQTQATKWFLQAAERGRPHQWHQLGMYYANGWLGPRNAAEAVKWYRKAADQGWANAQFDLAECYREGNGVPKDAAEAEKWYHTAAETYRKETERGYFWAQYRLGVLYHEGKGVPQDDAEAVKWLRLAGDFEDATKLLNKIEGVNNEPVDN